jgi:hypothetical protein
LISNSSKSNLNKFDITLNENIGFESTVLSSENNNCKVLNPNQLQQILNEINGTGILFT